MSDGTRQRTTKPKAKAAAKRRKPAAKKNPWLLPGASPAKAASRSRSQTGRKGAAARQSSGQGLDVNDATFEELRGAGLSVGQAARLLERRRLHGNFGSMDDVAKLRGFSKRRIGELQSKLQAGALR
jgi:DNA uptake protein ComE-like DNA-binding protein